MSRPILLTVVVLALLTGAALVWLPAGVGFISGTALAWVWCRALEREESTLSGSEPELLTAHNTD